MTGQDQHTAGRYVREDGEDRQAVPVCRLQGLAEAPRALLVVDQLNLQGKRDAALGEGLKKSKKGWNIFFLIFLAFKWSETFKYATRLRPFRS